jgi:hypothetical protein
MADSTLAAIETKVRRLTRSPSPSQLSQSDLDNYINTVILYDFPASLRLFSLRQTLTFYTQAGQDVYASNTIPNDPLNNFQNVYIAVHQPVYMGGYAAFYTQERNLFYGMYPQTNTIGQTGVFGDGLSTNYDGVTVGFPMLQNNVILTAVDLLGNNMVMVDTPSGSNAIGYLAPPGVTAVPSLSNFINYATGEFSVTFPFAVAAQSPIWSENIVYNPGRPYSMLYFNNEFTIRPVPDNAYAIQVEVDVRPTQLLAEGQSPTIEQWWQYIAFLAAKKIFEDRMDTDSLAQLLPMMKEQENMVLRTTLQQQANERTTTIYTQNKLYNYGAFQSAQWPY